LNRESKIIDAWVENSNAWLDAVKHEGLRRRGVPTRDVLLEVLEEYSPSGCRLLDFGCGEGWLSDEIREKDIEYIGIDASPKLIKHARLKGLATFHVGTAESLESLGLGKLDIVVCNFSLFGKESVLHFFSFVHQLLAEPGAVIVQTLHPCFCEYSVDYRSRWVQGTWAGLPGNFGEPSPLYFRTLEEWISLFKNNRLRLVEIREVKIGQLGEHSIIFVVQKDSTFGQSNLEN